MKSFISFVFKFLILICFFGGAYFILQKNKFNIKNKEKSSAEVTELQGKTGQLKKYLQSQKKPIRIEILSYTEKFKADVEEIKKMKVTLNPQSDFYITIQFFTDESDKEAPLIAQIRFLEEKSKNLIKEESLNLE